MRRFGRRNVVVKFSSHTDQIIPRACVSLLNQTKASVKPPRPLEKIGEGVSVGEGATVDRPVSDG